MIAIAPDSFKECLTAAEAARALAEGVRRALPDSEIVCVPMADGGEGTVDALVAATNGGIVELTATGPMGEPVSTRYGLLGDGTTAVIEMAAVSGLPLVRPEDRDPRIATTYGTGEVMRDALRRGVSRIIIGIGGSATNDGGAGMAQALGVSLRDARGRELPRGGAALARLATIDLSNRHPGLRECAIEVACDVDNPLCGPCGASRTYGPQKGATPEMVDELDAALRHFGEVIEAETGVSVLEAPGAGAAGGLGAGLLAFAGGVLRPGVELVAEACSLMARIAGAELVITGEGRIDSQTPFGKTPAGVAKVARERGIPVVAIAGSLGPGYETVYECGIDAVFSIASGPMSLAAAMERAPELLAATAEAVARVWHAGRREAGPM
ncbi:MAG TPA: glycerate kinase [Candidatus Hydrogenedentes bacterium]|nr:glycerate kinase [Candidatus Hydrogenedentota bacterium]HQH52542.1 glycerate kinase [Candidatus Hydrogenedentota bacterium]